MKHYYEQKIKRMLLSTDKANVKTAFRLLSNRPSLAPYVTWLFALSYYHTDVEIRKEAKSKFETLVPENFIECLDKMAGSNGVINLKEDIYHRNQAVINKRLHKIAQFGYLSPEELGNLTLYWHQSGFMFCYEHCIDIQENFTKKITKLDLRGKFKPGMEKLLPKFSQLTTLNLSHNYLTELPKELISLPRLTDLRAEYNYLEQINIVTWLPKLKRIDVAHNKITALPQNIGKLKKLKKLIITNNNLTRLPESIGKLKQLKTLDVYGNGLDRLPESFTQLKQLKNFYWGYNYLNLPNVFFDDFKFLKAGKNVSRSDGSWEAYLVSLENIFLIDSDYHWVDFEPYWEVGDGEQFFRNYDYHQHNTRNPWQKRGAAEFFMMENLMENFYNECASNLFAEAEELLISNELIKDDTKTVLKELVVIEDSYNRYLTIYDLYDELLAFNFYHIDVSHEAETDFLSNLSDKHKYLRKKKRDFQEIQTLRFHCQQPHYFNQSLLLHCIDDDPLDYLYNQVKTDPEIWAILQEEGMHLNYLEEAEVDDF